jgi:hypothetical protein
MRRRNRFEAVDLVVDRSSLVPPAGARLDQRTEQVARVGGFGRAGPAEDDLEWLAWVASAMTTDVRDQLADLVDGWGVAVLGGQEQRGGAVSSGGASHRWAMRPEPADPDRDPRTLQRPGQKRHVLHVVVATVVCHRLA